MIPGISRRVYKVVFVDSYLLLSETIMLVSCGPPKQI